MICAVLLILFSASCISAGPVPAVHSDFFERDQISPADIFDMADSDIPDSIPENHSSMILYLRMVGLKLVMAYYDFAEWLANKKDALLSMIASYGQQSRSSECCSCACMSTNAEGESSVSFSTKS